MPTRRTPYRAITRSTPTWVSRVLVAAAASGVAGVLLATVLGLGSTTFLGAADNGDGARLYCGAGLIPATPDHASNWKGAVVTGFTTGHDPCLDPVVSSALPILQLATIGAGSGVWSLSRLGWLYVALAAGVTGLAGWAATAAGLARGAAVLPGLAALAQPEFVRFFVSTFGEPAGLLGAYTAFSGVAALAVSRPSDRAARVVALCLTAAGGLLAVTAKPAYAPVLLVALAACVAARVQLAHRLPGHIVGIAVAAATAATAAAPVTAALAWQERGYAPVNAHNVVWTLVLPEVGPAATGPLGLPPDATKRSGEGYYVHYADGIPGWPETVGTHPDETLAVAYRLLAAHPGTLVRAVGVALQSTRGSDLDYLPSLPFGLPPETYPPPLAVYPDGYPVGAQGADTAGFTAWLDDLSLPWWPSVLTGTGLAVGAGALVLRRRQPGLLPGAVACGGIAGAAAASALGLAALAVLGDGYNELPKHVWLAAYMLDLTAAGLAAAAVCAAMDTLRHGGTAARSDERYPQRRGRGAPLLGQRRIAGR